MRSYKHTRSRRVMTISLDPSRPSVHERANVIGYALQESAERPTERVRNSRATWSIKTTGLRSYKIIVAKIRATLVLIGDHAARILIIGPEDQPMPLQDHGATINTDSDLARRRASRLSLGTRQNLHLNFIRKICKPRSPFRAPPLSMGLLTTIRAKQGSTLKPYLGLVSKIWHGCYRSLMSPIFD